MPATASMIMSSQLGTESPMSIMQAATASAPARTCPSAPMFQNRILNAGVTAREMHSSIARFCSSTQVLRFVPTAPLIMAAYTCIGSSPVSSMVMTAQAMSASTIAAARMAQALYQGRAARLEMCTRGTRFCYSSSFAPPSLVIIMPTFLLVAPRPSTRPLTLPPQRTSILSQSSSSTSRSSPT